MAIFTPGPVVAAASGSVGGTTYSHNKGGPYMRTRAIPTNRQSIAQVAQRSFIAAASQAWRELPAANALAWVTWAPLHPVQNALGNSVMLSGHQAFVQLNARLLHDGQTPILFPPLDVLPNPLTSLSFTADIGAGAVEATWTPTPLEATERVHFYAVVVDSLGINNVNSRYIYTARSALAAASPMDLEAQIISKHGALAVGQRIFLRANVFDTATGLVTAPLKTSAVVVETV